MKRVTRWVGLCRVALKQLRYHRARAFFAIVGIALAVLSVTLLLGVAAGVIATGEESVDRTEQDLWVSGGPVEVNPETVGGFQNPVVDAHEVAATIEQRDEIDNTAPMGFARLYIGATADNLETTFGVGLPGDGPLIAYEEGDGFTGGDTHYAGGEYDGEKTHQVVIDPGTAEEYDVTVGDTLHIGGTIRNAAENEYEVVGISTTFSEMTGTQAAAIRLSEMQTLTGTAYDDRATYITVRVEDNVDVSAVQQDLQEEYPEYEIRSNREQITAILEHQILLLASAVSLSALAILAGIFFSFNILLSIIYQQKREFTVYGAIGGSISSKVILGGAQALTITTLGGLAGLTITPVAAVVLEWLTATLTGFEGLVRVPAEAYYLAVGLIGVFGALSTLTALWQISDTEL